MDDDTRKQDGGRGTVKLGIRIELGDVGKDIPAELRAALSKFHDALPVWLHRDPRHEAILIADPLRALAMVVPDIDCELLQQLRRMRDARRPRWTSVAALPSHVAVRSIRLTTRGGKEKAR